LYAVLSSIFLPDVMDSTNRSVTTYLMEFGPVKYIIHKSDFFMKFYRLPITCNNTGSFLATMLEGVQSIVRNFSCLIMTPNTKHFRCLTYDFDFNKLGIDCFHNLPSCSTCS